MTRDGSVLFNKQRYEFFSKSQLERILCVICSRCCSISKDTNFSANHNGYASRSICGSVLFNKQRYEFFSKSQLPPSPIHEEERCCSISKDTNFSANHNMYQMRQVAQEVLFNKQRYEFFSKSQRSLCSSARIPRCCSISKDTNFSANHNIRASTLLCNWVLFNKQRYEFFSKSQRL